MIDFNNIYSTILSKENIYHDIIAKTHKVDKETAKRIFNSEVETFMNRLSEYATGEPNATLTIPQGGNIFLEVMNRGLSFSKSANHVYLSRLKGTGTAIGFQITADGLVYLAQKAGAIDHLSEPVLVQQGEQFSIRSTEDGRQVVDHIIKFDGRPPLTFENLLLGYIYIIYPNGNRELSWISKNRLSQYKDKSVNKSMYNDESFLQTKVIKHALRKVRKTDFMMDLQNEEDETIAENMEWEEIPTDTAQHPATNEYANQTNEPF